MKRFLRIFAAVTAAALTCSLLTACAEPKSKKDDGVMRESMNAMDFVKEMGIGINLGNTMEGFYEDKKNICSGSSVLDGVEAYEKCWNDIITTQEIIDGMKEAGFDIVRIPVYWGNGMKNDGKFIVSDELLDRVEEIIDYARNSGMYVVVNIHHYDEYIIRNFERKEAVEIISNVWTQIANRYKDYSDYVIFEGFNENVGSYREEDEFSTEEIYDYVLELNQAFVDAVRSTGGNNESRVLIASGYWTNIDNTTSWRFKMPKDTAEDKLMISVHYVDNAMYWSNKIGSREWHDYTVSQLELLKEAFTSKDIPVFLGETSAGYPEDRFANDAYITDSSDALEEVLTLITDYGFIPVIWDTNNNFYDRHSCKIRRSSDSKVIEKISRLF